MENKGEFGDVKEAPIPVPDINKFDTDGSYHEFKGDEWGTLWKFRIFCMQGHPAKWPLEDIEKV